MATSSSRVSLLACGLAAALAATLAAPDAAGRIAEIYAGTWGDAGAAEGRVLRLLDGDEWEVVGGGPILDTVWDLEWSEGVLWAAGMNGPPSTLDAEVQHGDEGRVFRWDGVAWEDVSPDGGFASAATTVSAIGGRIYVTVDQIGLVEWLGGRDWGVVSEFRLAAQAVVSDAHDGRPLLYLGQDNTDEFWVHDPEGLLDCGDPGVNPATGEERCQRPTGSVCSADCHPGSCIHAMAEFDDGSGPRVYGGAWQGRMYRWEPATRLFVRIDDIPDETRPVWDLEHVQGLASFRGRLWAGVSDGRLWSSVDATAATWEIEHELGEDVPVSDALAVTVDDTLWIGTGGVPWRWARRDGLPGVRALEDDEPVVRGAGPLFGRGTLVLLAVVPEILCDAGAPQVVECGGETTDVVLDGTGTVVSQGFDATFTWTGPFLGGTATGVTPTVTFEGTGTHEVTLTVTAGRRTENCTTFVTIEDTTPPSIAAEAGCLWPPNHRYRCLGVGEFLASVAPAVDDACDGEVGVRIVDAWSSQPEDSPDRGDGATQDDLLFDAERVCVRAERLGADPAGRTYSIALEATDAAGNVGRAVATLHVPHDQREARRCERTRGEVGLLPRAELPLGPDVREGRYPD